jgi:hypothetical protein
MFYETSQLSVAGWQDSPGDGSGESLVFVQLWRVPQPRLRNEMEWKN